MTGINLSSTVVVIKLGGNIAIQVNALNDLAHLIKDLTYKGIKVVLCHGGGSQISSAFTSAGEEVEFVSGLRVTSSRGAEIVKSVLCQTIQPAIVEKLNELNIPVIGICGDTGVFSCQKMTLEIDGEKVDIGHVGDVTSVDISSINSAIQNDFVPVISAVGSDTFGNLYNINADTGAAAIAAALKAKNLVLVTDVDGLYLQWPDKNFLVTRIAKEDVRTLLPKVESGMRPKLEAALRALDGGVVHVNLINGNPIRNIEDLLIHGKDLGTLVHS